MDIKNVLQTTHKNLFNSNTLFYSSLFYGTVGGSLTWNLNHLTHGFFYLSIQTLISSTLTLVPYYFIRNAIINENQPLTASLDEHHLFYLSKLADILLFLPIPITSSLLANILFKIQLLSVLYCQLLGLGIILGVGIVIDATFTFFNSYHHKLKNVELLNPDQQNPIKKLTY